MSERETAKVTSYLSGGGEWPWTAIVKSRDVYAIDIGKSRDDAEKSAIAKARAAKLDQDRNGGRAEQVREVEL